MRKIIKKYDVYKFDELNEKAQNKAISNYIEDLAMCLDIDNINKNSNLYKAWKECEKMSTPWFLPQYIFDYCKKDILKELKKWEYYEDGGVYYENKQKGTK